MVTVKQLDDDGDGDEHEMSVARLSMGGVDCQKVKLLFRCVLPLRRSIRRAQAFTGARVDRGEEMVEFKAHGGNAVHVTGQLLVRPWVSDDANTEVRVSVSGATLPATPAPSSKKRAAADQRDSATEQKQAKKQRRAEEASRQAEEEAKAAEAVGQQKAEKKAAAERLRKKKEQQAAAEEKQAALKAAKKEKEKAAAAAAKAKPEPFIQSRKFTGRKKGKSPSLSRVSLPNLCQQPTAACEMRKHNYDYL